MYDIKTQNETEVNVGVAADGEPTKEKPGKTDSSEKHAKTMRKRATKGAAGDSLKSSSPRSAKLAAKSSPAKAGVVKKPDRYFEAVGRRKTAIARVRLFTRAGDFEVNDKQYAMYFLVYAQQKIAEDALSRMKLLGRFRVSARISGGGMHAQAEALRHGLARCLIKFNPDFRKRLKRAGLLTRDARAKERKKFGLKKARRAPQWAKR